jgi:copper(I)-binding protein
MARMRQVKGVDVPAQGKAVLAPGGYHVMFIKLKGPLTEGAEVPAVLTFEKAGEVAVKFIVRPLGHQAGGMHEHGMKH